MITSRFHLPTCPTCASHHTIKNGKENSQQRYKCKTCGKNFRQSTQTAIHRIHKKHLIAEYLNCMLENKPLRQSARTCGISLATAFYWRHKLLKKMLDNSTKTPNSKNILSVLQLPYSQKGTRKPHTNSHRTVTSMVLQGEKGIWIAKCQQQTQRSAAMRADWPPILAYKKNKAIEKSLKTDTPATTPEQNSAISTAHAEIHAWLDIFRGVATKYLQNYWAWYQCISEIRATKNEYRFLCERSIFSSSKNLTI